MGDIEQRRAARRQRLGTSETTTQVQEETKASIIDQDNAVPVPALFKQGETCNGWVLTENGWEMRDGMAE